MSQKGFTLIELLMVLVILSGAAALVAPRLASSWDSLRLRGAARSLVAVVRYARIQAITTRRRVTLNFDLDKQSYQMAFEGNHGGNGGADFSRKGEGEGVEGQGKWERVFFIPPGVRLKGAWERDGTDPLGVITFFPRGSSSGGEILLVSSEGKRLWVRVEVFSGRPEILSSEEEEDVHRMGN